MFSTPQCHYFDILLLLIHIYTLLCATAILTHSSTHSRPISHSLAHTSILIISCFPQCTDPKAKEKFQQISIAYTKLISSRSSMDTEDSDDDDDDDDDEGQMYEDDVHEMRAFMRMFMDLVGIFNDDQVVPDEGKVPGAFHYSGCALSTECSVLSIIMLTVFIKIHELRCFIRNDVWCACWKQ